MVVGQHVALCGHEQRNVRVGAAQGQGAQMVVHGAGRARVRERRRRRADRSPVPWGATVEYTFHTATTAWAGFRDPTWSRGAAPPC